MTGKHLTDKHLMIATALIVILAAAIVWLTFMVVPTW